jgi:hypothetical protein
VLFSPWRQQLCAGEFQQINDFLLEIWGPLTESSSDSAWHQEGAETWDWIWLDMAKAEKPTEKTERPVQFWSIVYVHRIDMSMLDGWNIIHGPSPQQPTWACTHFTCWGWKLHLWHPLTAPSTGRSIWPAESRSQNGDWRRCHGESGSPFAELCM